MNLADVSRLQARLNLLEVQTDVLGPVITAGIVQATHSGAADALREASDPSPQVLYAPMFFAEQWLIQVRAVAEALQAIALEPAFLPAGRIAATSFNAAFPGVAVSPELKFVMVTGGVVFATGPKGSAEFPINPDALASLEGIVTTFIDALPSRASLEATG